MKQLFEKWRVRYLSDPEAIILLLFLVAAIVIVSTLGTMLAPVFASLVIAYLLEGLVNRLEKKRCPHLVAVISVFLLFIGLFSFALFIICPLLIRQLTALFAELPSTLGHMQALLMQLPESFPDYVSVDQIHNLLAHFKSSLGSYGKTLLSFSLASIPGLIAMIVYLVLVPLMVFFFLLDRDKLVGWLTNYLPKKRGVMTGIWREVDYQLGNYVRGKFLEIMIVGGAAFFAFALMGLQYTVLLAVLVGLSVLVPFIGVTVVTIPVEIIAFLQWGWSPHFAYLTIIYAIICLLDANLLVPLLFSEAVNLHPVAIIVGILFFGGLWGFWGVFFAIPLATLVQAIILAWPRSHAHEFPEKA